MLKKAALCMVLALPWALQAGNAVCETLLTLMAILAIVLHRDILTDRSILKNHTFLLLLLAYLIINAAIIAPSVRSIASSIGMIRIPLGIVLVSQTLKRHPQALLFFSYSCVGSLLWMFTNTLLQVTLG